MDQLSDKQALLQEIDKEQDRYDDKKDRARFGAVAIKLLTALLGAAISVLLGWKTDGKPIEFFTNLAACFGAAVSLMNIIDGFFSFSDRWISHKETLMQLFLLEKELEDDLNVDGEKVLIYKNRLKSIVVDAKKRSLDLHKTKK